MSTKPEKTSSFTEVDEAIPTGESYQAVSDTSSAVAVSGQSSYSPVVSDPSALGRTQGEVRSTDINIPKLTVVNPMSEAAGDVPFGSILLAGEIVLAPIETALEIIILGLRKEYEQVIPFGTEGKPLRAKTMAEVRGLGGTLDRKDKTKVPFQDIAYMTVLVPCPPNADESVQSYFRQVSPDGRKWAKALYIAKSFSYTNVAKPVITREQMTEEPHFATTWIAETEEQKNEQKKTKWYQFRKLKTGTLLDADTRNWAMSKA